MRRAFALASQTGFFTRAFFESLGIVILFHEWNQCFKSLLYEAP